MSPIRRAVIVQPLRCACTSLLTDHQSPIGRGTGFAGSFFQTTRWPPCSGHPYALTLEASFAGGNRLYASAHVTRRPLTARKSTAAIPAACNGQCAPNRGDFPASLSEDKPWIRSDSLAREPPDTRVIATAEPSSYVRNLTDGACSCRYLPSPTGSVREIGPACPHLNFSVACHCASAITGRLSDRGAVWPARQRRHGAFEVMNSPSAFGSSRANGTGYSSRERVCPRCSGSVYRVPRRFVDLLLSIFVPVRRYRCGSMGCSWEGDLRKKAASPAEPGRR